MQMVLSNYVITLGYLFALVIILGLALPIYAWIANKILGEVDLLKEIRKKNLAAGILLSALVIGAALIIGFAI